MTSWFGFGVVGFIASWCLIFFVVWWVVQVLVLGLLDFCFWCFVCRIVFGRDALSMVWVGLFRFGCLGLFGGWWCLHVML